MNIDKELRDKMSVYTDADKARIELIKRAMAEPSKTDYDLLPKKAKKKYSEKLALRLRLTKLKRLVNK